MRRARASVSSLDVSVQLPYGLSVAHLALAVERLGDMTHALDTSLTERGMRALSAWLPKGAISTLVSAGLAQALEDVAPGLLVVNTKLDGYPDVLLAAAHRDDAARAARQGIEVKVTARGRLTFDAHVRHSGWHLVAELATDPTSDLPIEITDIYIARLTARDFRAMRKDDPSAGFQLAKSGTTKLRAGHVYHVEQADSGDLECAA